MLCLGMRKLALLVGSCCHFEGSIEAPTYMGQVGWLIELVVFAGANWEICMLFTYLHCRHQIPRIIFPKSSVGGFIQCAPAE